MHDVFRIPLKTESVANKREHWSITSRRKRNERNAVRVFCDELRRWREVSTDISVTMVRVAPRCLDDDNLAGSFKAIRDEIAALIGRDDKPGSGVSWAYEQYSGGRGRYRVIIEVTDG